MSRVFGANPRPRILLERIPAELHDQFRTRFPTVRAVSWRAEVDQAEFDVLVTSLSPDGADAHLFVIAFWEPISVNKVIERVQVGQTNFPILWLGMSRGHEFHVPKSLDEAIQRFMHNHVIPIVDQKAENRVMGENFGGSPVVTPFLNTARGEVLAGRFRRISGSECWVFPSAALERSVECLEVAVNLWRLQDLSRFP